MHTRPFHLPIHIRSDHTWLRFVPSHPASYVMTYHTVLKSSDQYVDAIFWARRLSDNVTQSLNITVFPYSVFYVFYEQYLHAIHDMAVNLGASLGKLRSLLLIVALLLFNLLKTYTVFGVELIEKSKQIALFK